jgi:hypothetical protein
LRVLPAILIVLALVGAALQGCGGPQRVPQGARTRGAPPAYTEIAEKFNQRVGPLERLWARTAVGVWYRDKEGKDRHDQFEGHFQYLRPDRVLLTFDKVGQNFAALGSDSERFWWVQKEPEPKAYVGEHARVTPQQLAQIGLPVHPLSLLDLLAVTPLPANPDARGSVVWSPDGRLLGVTAPGRMGMRRLWLDPSTYEPRRVELLATVGDVVLAADLSKHQPIAVRSPKTGWSPTVATILEGSQASDGLRIRMTLFDPETGGGRPKAQSFDFDRWRDALGVREIERLDQGAPGAAR